MVDNILLILSGACFMLAGILVHSTPRVTVPVKIKTTKYNGGRK